MSIAPPIPDGTLEPAGPIPRPDDALIVYILNVGDGDAIVIEFPRENGTRTYAVVDSNDGGKTRTFLRNQLGADSLQFICATHPHLDHVRGLQSVLTNYTGQVHEFWDSGFGFTSTPYSRLILAALQEAKACPHFRVLRPTAGYETYINGVTITVLSPSIGLRNRYTTHGVNLNNASIVLLLEYPSTPLSDRYPVRGGAPPKWTSNARAIILGADAQTDAWSRVLDDFPHIEPDQGNWMRRVTQRHGREPLRCDTLKVSHHCSKHGVNLELVERMMGSGSGGGQRRRLRYLLSSCADGPASGHGFPHVVAQEILREVREPLAKAGGVRSADHELGIHYTSQLIDLHGVQPPAGSMAIVMDKLGSNPALYRLCDDRQADPDLNAARKVKP